jgi:hypothetical protein
MPPGDTLQATVDALADQFGLSVLIEDADFQALSWSVQTDVDDVRLHSILRRGVPEAAVEAVHRLGLPQADGPVHVPAVPEAGLEPRWCVALRVAGNHVGYLWVLDPQNRIGPQHLPALISAAAHANSVIAGPPRPMTTTGDYAISSAVSNAAPTPKPPASSQSSPGCPTTPWWSSTSTTVPEDGPCTRT